LTYRGRWTRIVRKAKGGILVQPDNFADTEQYQAGAPILSNPYGIAWADLFTHRSRLPGSLIPIADFHHPLRGNK
jgi:hypothetical protein